MLSNCSCSQGCKTALGTFMTPLARTSPVAGRNKVMSLAPPSRRYSCGCSLGCPSSCQHSPGPRVGWHKDRLHLDTTAVAHRPLPLDRHVRSTFFFLGLRVAHAVDA